MNQTKSSYWSLVAGIAAAVCAAIGAFILIRSLIDFFWYSWGFFDGLFTFLRHYSNLLLNIIGMGLLCFAAFLKNRKPLSIIGLIVLLASSCLYLTFNVVSICNYIVNAFESLLDWDIVYVLWRFFEAFIRVAEIAAPPVALILAIKYTGSKKVASARAKRLFWLPALCSGICELSWVINPFLGIGDFDDIPERITDYWGEAMSFILSLLTSVCLVVVYFALMKWLAETAPETVTAPAAPQAPVYAIPAQPRYATPAQPQYATPAQPRYATPAQPQYATPAPSTVDPVTELQRYKALADAGVITAEDYEAKKKQLLNL